MKALGLQGHSLSPQQNDQGAIVRAILGFCIIDTVHLLDQNFLDHEHIGDFFKLQKSTLSLTTWKQTCLSKLAFVIFGTTDCSEMDDVTDAYRK